MVLLCGCHPSGEAQKPEKTQLEIREFQTRTFDVQDQRLVMKSILNVLQDDGYIVKNVALDLGFLTANKEIDIEEARDRFWAQFSRGREARWPKHELIEATINVSEFGTKTRIRANFQFKVFDNTGAVVVIRPIIEEEFYQEFFTKVSKGIFIQEQNI
jgi:hypothetical protein